MDHINKEQLKMLKAKEVADITSISVPYLYELISKDKFPRPYRLGARAVAWRLSDIKRWLDSRPLTKTYGGQDA